MRTKWQFEPDDGVKRLDGAVSRYLGVGRSEAQSRIKAGLVTVDGAVQRKVAYILRHKVWIGAGVLSAKSAAALPPPVLQTVYADNHLAVVDKPPGVVVHSGPGHTSGTVSDAIKQWTSATAKLGEVGREGIVHRLDRDTSGLMVVALSESGFGGLKRAVQRRELRRIYTALVTGAPPAPNGVIEAPLGRHPRQRTKHAVVANGRYARTHYRTLKRLSRHTLLELELDTGRTHQIRVHCAALSMPVVGDRVYGVRENVPQGLERQFLHSSQLSLTHPVEGVSLKFKSALPKDLRAVWSRLLHEG